MLREKANKTIGISIIGPWISAVLGNQAINLSPHLINHEGAITTGE
jgi:hypothetical protein